MSSYPHDSPMASSKVSSSPPADASTPQDEGDGQGIDATQPGVESNGLDALQHVVGQGPRDWRDALSFVTQTMRDLSSQTDPQAMVKAYGDRMRQIIATDRFLALSRRGLSRPEFLITRDTHRKEEIDPWEQRAKLPHLKGGLLADLLYDNQAIVDNDLHVPPDDPAAEFLADARSLMAVPTYDSGEALNMTVFLERRPNAFRPEMLPHLVWTGNLFGRATHSLVLARELRKAKEMIEKEMQTIGDIQRSLLPRKLPDIASMELAAYYEPAAQAGGDYYDFFPMHDGQWGILIADVSGHGSPAAVLMAITHVLAHTRANDHTTPGDILGYVNKHLADRYIAGNGAFVTAFFGQYDPATRRLTYANAGHPPPRVKPCGIDTAETLDNAGNLPLGVLPDVSYTHATAQLYAGDQLVLYTDGIIETFGPGRELFGTDRLDTVLSECGRNAQATINAILDQVNTFAKDSAAEDDRTLIVGRLR